MSEFKINGQALWQPPALRTDWREACFVASVVAMLAAFTLHNMGRLWWCQCGGWSPWSWNIWSKHNSQHLIDPYFFTHVLHGFVFYALLKLLPLGEPEWPRFGLAVLTEAIWEIFENTDMVINRYREATISLDYFGDSIANSMIDILACALGYLAASMLATGASVAFFLSTEVILLMWIRDSLIVNVIMLAYPIEAIKNWQSAAGQ